MHRQGQPGQSTVHVGSERDRKPLMNQSQSDDSQPLDLSRSGDSLSGTTRNHPSTTLPPQLQCPLCKELFTDAVVFPCCRFSSCRHCTKTEDFCPCCKTPDPMPVPNKNLRQMVQVFILETGHTSEEVELRPRGSDGKDTRTVVVKTASRSEDKYSIKEFIDEGAFGKVYLARRKADAKKVMVKFINKWKIPGYCGRTSNMPIPLEVVLLAQLNHPNIVQFIEMFQNPDFFQMVMDKHDDCIDLCQYINRQPKHDEALCSHIFRQLVQAVSYIHSKRIVHRDIKDENIIIHRDLNVKLIDFGSAVQFHPDRPMRELKGSRYFYHWSPEALRGESFLGPELDLWSLGVLLYMLVFHRCPFNDAKKIRKCEISGDLNDLLYFMLHPHIKERYTMKALKEHVWVLQSVDLSRYNWDDVMLKAVRKDN